VSRPEAVNDDDDDHKRTSQEGCGRAAAPQTRAKPLVFGQKLNFSGRSQQPKMKKTFFGIY